MVVPVSLYRAKIITVSLFLQIHVARTETINLGSYKVHMELVLLVFHRL